MKDSSENGSYQFRSLLLTAFSIIKGKRAFEVMLAKGKFLRKKYVNFVRRSIESSDVVVFEGPWQYLLFKPFLSHKLVIYDAHNCETELRTGNIYHNFVKELESELIRECDLLFCVTNKDYVSLMELNGGDSKKFYLIPHLLGKETIEWNGLNSHEITFIGSMYGPNISAFKFILDLSAELHEFTFNIIGNVASTVRKSKYGNVNFCGVVSEEEKTSILSRSMIALNPVEEGSGRNVKMIDYLKHKLPVISTTVGVRGLEQYLDTGGIIVTDRSGFKDVILKYSNDRDSLLKLSNRSGVLYMKVVENEGTKSPTQIIVDELS